MKSHNPIITGNTVTLTWHGEQAPYLLSDLHGWEEHPQPFQAVDKGGWAVSFELPLNAYLEYAFYDPQTKQRLPDPLNRKRVYNGVGAWNHFFYMPEAQPTPWLKPPSGGLRGQITRHTVTAERVTASKARRVWLYRPPGNDPLPLLLVYDGEDYLRRGKLAVIVDNLIAARHIRPLAIAFVQNGSAARMVEYSQADSTLLFVMRQILPLAARELNLVDYEKHPGVHGVLGASMGGLMAVFTALRLPFVFGKAISQAGAFALWQQETVTMQMVRYFPKPDVQLWLDCGVMDFLREPNRRMAALLSEKGYRATYRENGGAHNYTTWRNACVEALETLFG